MKYDKEYLCNLLINYLFVVTEDRVKKDICAAILIAGKEVFPDFLGVYWCKFEGIVYTSTLYTHEIYVPYTLAQEIHLPIEHKNRLKKLVLQFSDLMVDKCIITSLFQKIFNTFSRLEDVCFILPNSLNKIHEELQRVPHQCAVSDSVLKFVMDNQKDINRLNERILTNFLLNDATTK